MVFGTFEFFIFLAAALAVYWFLKPWPRIRKIFLAAAGAFYYWLIDPRFAGLIAIAGAITFLLALAAGKKNASAKTAVLFAVAANLGILLWFKYYDFFRVSAQSFAASLGMQSTLPFWEIAFPVGISFYSFRMISYAVDVYRQKYAPETSLVDFFAYVFFFPVMLAGPIVRAGDFLSQLKNNGPDKPLAINAAAAMLFLGLFKKIIVSSWLAQNLVDDGFAVPEQISALSAWLAAIGYTLQIYCDFSGYSDIAIAAAMFLGFRLAPNFEYPYRARSIAGFWRRWHISFYSWMRDYVYIPLGGNRAGKIRSYLNTVIVFGLSGLWHGAAGHYLLWGLWHGAGLCVQRLWQELKLPRTAAKLGAAANNFAGWFLTFAFVGAGWIIFRAENLDRTFAFASRLIDFSPAEPIPPGILLPLAAIALFVAFEKDLSAALNNIQKHIPSFAWLPLWLAAIAAIYYFAPQTVPPFIYFSF